MEDAQRAEGEKLCEPQAGVTLPSDRGVDTGCQLTSEMLCEPQVVINIPSDGGLDTGCGGAPLRRSTRVRRATKFYDANLGT
jgi:hypothetical protein